MKRSYPDKYKTDQITSFGNEDSLFLKQQEMKMKAKNEGRSCQFKAILKGQKVQVILERLKSFEKVSKKNKNRYTNAWLLRVLIQTSTRWKTKQMTTKMKALSFSNNKMDRDRLQSDEGTFRQRNISFLSYSTLTRDLSWKKLTKWRFSDPNDLEKKTEHLSQKIKKRKMLNRWQLLKETTVLNYERGKTYKIYRRKWKEWNPKGTLLDKKTLELGKSFQNI